MSSCGAPFLQYIYQALTTMWGTGNQEDMVRQTFSRFAAQFVVRTVAHTGAPMANRIPIQDTFLSYGSIWLWGAHGIGR
jgi:hypothetical protein